MSNATQRTRALIGAADPARGAEPARPRLSAAELIAHAETTTLPRSGRPALPKRRLAIAAGVTVLAAGTVAVVQPLGPSTLDSQLGPPAVGQGSGVAGAVLAPIAYQLDHNAPAAGPQLRALAARVGPAPYDTATGRYAYHLLRTWGDPSVTSPDGYVLGYCTEQQVWSLPDGSGVVRDIPLPPQFPDEASRRFWEKHLPQSQTRPRRYDMPAYPGAGPTPTDRAGMAELLDTQYGPGAVTKMVDKLYRHEVVSRSTRALVLSVIADVPGFRWRGKVTDRAGRRGVAITWDDPAHQQRFLLIFDPRTGALLADEAIARSDRVSSYSVILETTRTDRTG
jgi:hypothetical protein